MVNLSVNNLGENTISKEEQSVELMRGGLLPLSETTGVWGRHDDRLDGGRPGTIVDVIVESQPDYVLLASVNVWIVLAVSSHVNPPLSCIPLIRLTCQDSLPAKSWLCLPSPGSRSSIIRHRSTIFRRGKLSCGGRIENQHQRKPKVSLIKIWSTHFREVNSIINSRWLQLLRWSSHRGRGL